MAQLTADCPRCMQTISGPPCPLDLRSTRCPGCAMRCRRQTLSLSMLQPIVWSLQRLTAQANARFFLTQSPHTPHAPPTLQSVLETMLASVEAYGFVPNGLRSYYLNRSQPPLLSQVGRVHMG